jgi:hypothetical protein
LDEIKMWTDWTIPKLQFKDNNTVVWSINATTIDGHGCVAIWWSGNYIWLVWTTICSGYLKIPVWTNLYN